MLQHKSYKFKLDPTKGQKQRLNQIIGNCRRVYNHFLALKIREYKDNGKSLSYNELQNMLPAFKQQKGLEWLKLAPAQSYQAALRNLDTAYQNFFRTKKGYPKFKNRHSKQSFKLNDPRKIKIRDNRIQITKFKEGIRYFDCQPIVGDIIEATVTKSKSNEYFISIVCKVDIQYKAKTNKSIGIDVGIKNAVTLSDGKVFNLPNQKPINNQIKRQQKHLSRKTYDSNRYVKCRIKLAKLHEQKANARANSYHQLSAKLVTEYDTICIETLNIKGMVKNHKLAESIQEKSWYSFFTMLDYKCKWYGKELVKVGTFFPSSKMCNACGHVKETLSLNERTYDCESCGTSEDRDVNAAINILNQGLVLLKTRTNPAKTKIKSAGIVDHKRGEKVILAKDMAKPLRPSKKLLKDKIDDGTIYEALILNSGI